jgi:hypothetical protein
MYAIIKSVISCTGDQARSHSTAELFEHMDKELVLARENTSQTLIMPKGISKNSGTASHRSSA